MPYIIRYYRDQKILGIETRNKDGLEIAISRANEAIESGLADRAEVLDGDGSNLYCNPA